MGIYSIKPAFQRRLGAARDFFIRRKVGADALTWAALLASVGGGLSIAWSSSMRGFLLLVPALALGRITLNALDGMVAVATGTARPFGEVLNEFSDRLSDSAWFAGLAFVLGPGTTLSALVLVLLASYLGTVAKAAGGRRLYNGLMGKADRMVLLSTAAVAAFFIGPILLQGFVFVVIAGSIETIAARLYTARRELQRTERS